MAGSYDHCVADDGQLLVNEDFADMIENLGDAFEAVEEMYGMIWYLAQHLADPAGAVQEAWRRYQEGLRLSPGTDGHLR